MKKSIFLFFFVASFFKSFAQSPPLLWAADMGGLSTDRGNSIAVDASGNIYTTGGFGGTVDFDPGVGTYTLTSIGNYDIFISKLDANGNFVWAKSMGWGNGDIGNSIGIDASGNVYTTGSFNGTVDFDPGAGTYTLASLGASAIFISKLDAAGNFVWAKNIGSALASDGGISLAFDATNNVYTTGVFDAVADFDPGVGTYTMASAGSNDAFILKLDPAGNFVWAKRIGGSMGDGGKAICVDGSGNVFTSGYYMNTVDFDPGPATYTLASTAGFNDIFILKLDASGNFIWAKNVGSDSYLNYGNSIATNASGDVYITGNFGSTVDFDPDAGTYTLTAVGGNADAFILKLSSAGNFVWANRVGAASDDNSNSISLDASGNIYTTGSFGGTVDFDPGAGTYTLASAGNTDIFVSKLDATGNFLWANRMGGTNADIGNSVIVDVFGSICTTGSFNGIVDFDSGAGTYTLNSAGMTDIFIQKIGLPIVGIETLSGKNDNICFYPNPASISVNIKLDNNDYSEALSKNGIYDLKITNVVGEVVKLEEVSFVSDLIKTDVNNLSEGVYMFNLSNKTGFNMSRKIVVSR